MRLLITAACISRLLGKEAVILRYHLLCQPESQCRISIYISIYYISIKVWFLYSEILLNTMPLLSLLTYIKKQNKTVFKPKSTLTYVAFLFLTSYIGCIRQTMHVSGLTVYLQLKMHIACLEFDLYFQLWHVVESAEKSK